MAMYRYFFFLASYLHFDPCLKLLDVRNKKVENVVQLVMVRFVGSSHHAVENCVFLSIANRAMEITDKQIYSTHTISFALLRLEPETNILLVSEVILGEDRSTSQDSE